MTDEIVPVHLDALREWFLDYFTSLLGHPPTHEDWYRFLTGVQERSLVQARAFSQEEQDDLLLEEALRQTAADLNMTVTTWPLRRRQPS